MSDYIPKVGDLVRDKINPKDLGVIVEIDESSYTNYYKVVGNNGLCGWLPKDYILYECEVICETR